jgi:hypothetical protein
VNAAGFLVTVILVVQAALMGHDFPDNISLRLEQQATLENAIRIQRACEEYFIDAGKGAAAFASLLLGRSLRARM